MKKYMVIVALLFVALAAPKVSRADQTYDVNFSAGSDTITGTITTNGSMGTLGTIQLDSFQFGVSRSITSPAGGGSDKEGESGSIGDIVITGDAVSATAAGLFFNFDATDQSSLEFLDADNNFIWCLFTDEGCDPAGSGSALTLDGTTLTVTGLDGNQMIASVATAPEPGTLGLMLIGTVGLMFVARRRFAQALRLDAGTN
jgi:hypothetical protein